MRNTNKKNIKQLARPILQGLNELQQEISKQVTNQPHPAEAKFIAIRTALLNEQHHFGTLEKGTVRLMEFVGRVMVETSSREERAEQASYISMLYGLYQFFGDLQENVGEK